MTGPDFVASLLQRLEGMGALHARVNSSRSLSLKSGLKWSS
jgi:hypothetical protein